MGGKWTICRLMGEETIDKVIEILKSKITYSLYSLTFLEKGVKLRLHEENTTKKFKLLGSFVKDSNVLLVNRKKAASFYINKLC